MLDMFTEELINSYHEAKNIQINDREKAILHNLGEKVKELSERPIENEKRDLWYKHNMLKPTRPLIACDPENGWSEIIFDNDIECEHYLPRIWESELRKIIFWGEQMNDDRVIEPIINIPFVYEKFCFGLEPRVIKTEEKGSFTWEPPIKDYELDMKKLHYPQANVDINQSKKIMEVAQDTFDGILNIKQRGVWWWTLGLTWRLASLRGLENFMLDMYDNPDYLHRLMGFLRDAYIYLIRDLERRDLLTLNNDGIAIGSGGFGYTDELPDNSFKGQVRAKDIWGFAEAQETVSISPKMFGEYVFPYQLEILKEFGLNHYGCCEPLNNRWDYIKTIPRLRRVSVSPWADIEDMADKLGSKYIYSMKPSPVDLSVPNLDKSLVRKKIKEAMKKSKGCIVELIMQDTHTIGNNPKNVIDWCRIAKEESFNL